MSASSQCVTCGTLTHDACRRGPEMRLMRDSGTVSTGPNLAKSTAGIAGQAAPPAGAAPAPPRDSAALTSSRVMRPFSPVPLTVLRSRPSSRASRRTAGPAKTPEKSALAGPEAGGERGRQIPRRDGRGFGRFGRVLLFLRVRFVLLRRRDRRGRSAGVELRDQRAHRHLVADLGDNLGDLAGRRRRHVHRRLVGFERHKRLLRLDRVARLHQDLDDRHVLEVADVGDRDVDRRRLAGDAGAAAALAGAAEAALAGAAAALAGAAVRAASPAAESMRAISVPIDTLSPTFATTSATAPATGEGTSIVALSDSSVTSDCSAFTTSPGFTSTSMIGHVLEVADIGNVHVDFRHRRSPQRQRLNGDGERVSFAPGSAPPGRCRISRSPRPRAGSAAIARPPAPSGSPPRRDSGRPRRTSADRRR